MKFFFKSPRFSFVKFVFVCKNCKSFTAVGRMCENVPILFVFVAVDVRRQRSGRLVGGPISLVVAAGAQPREHEAKRQIVADAATTGDAAIPRPQLDAGCIDGRIA